MEKRLRRNCLHFHARFSGAIMGCLGPPVLGCSEVPAAAPPGRGRAQRAPTSREVGIGGSWLRKT
eukprot:8414984-Pyramimonas_sp.AAC.1